MKRFVKVKITWNTDGTIIPERIFWDTYRSYPIDAVTDVRLCESEEFEREMRYTCLIWGKKKTLFFNGKRWYVISDNA